MRTGVKLKLSSICASPDALHLLRHIAEKAHIVRTAAYLLVKHYMLVKLHCNAPIPIDLESLFRDAIVSLSAKRPRSDSLTDRKQALRELLCRDFPHPDASKFSVDTEHLTGNWLNYEAKQYASHVEVHIKTQFHKCLFAFVEAEFGLNAKDPLELATIRHKIRDISRGDSALFPASYALPRALITTDEDFNAHVEEFPLAYLGSMIHMSSRLEYHGRLHKVTAVLPLVKTQVPGHTLIDTQILLDFMPKAMLQGQTKAEFRSTWSTPGTRGRQARQVDVSRRLVDGQSELWKLVFDLDRCKPRGDAWSFDNMIHTDGYACNLILRTRADQMDGPRRAFKTPSNRPPSRIAAPRVIAVDPGKNNLIYCVDDATPVYANRRLVERGSTFRYTRAQRNFETKKQSRQAEAERYKTQNCPEASEWEALLRGHSSRTTDVSCFIRFIEQFLASRSALRPFYSRLVHRRNRFEAYRLQQKSESKLMATFKRRMRCLSKSARERTVIAFGDGARQNLRRSAPGPSSRIRRLFLRNHFKVIDVHEAYTSKRCFHCKQAGSENGPHRHLPAAPNQRARPWSRDYHACLNIAILARALLDGLPRPAYLCR